MEFNLDGKKFISLSNVGNGEVSVETVFYYHQQGKIVWAEYEGGVIQKGHLIAKVLENGVLDIRYHHINTHGDLKIGKCRSTPEILDNGRIKFKEEWQWLSGDMSEGVSEIIETE